MMGFLLEEPLMVFGVLAESNSSSGCLIFIKGAYRGSAEGSICAVI